MSYEIIEHTQDPDDGEIGLTVECLKCKKTIQIFADTVECAYCEVNIKEDVDNFFRVHNKQEPIAVSKTEEIKTEESDAFSHLLNDNTEPDKEKDPDAETNKVEELTEETNEVISKLDEAEKKEPADEDVSIHESDDVGTPNEEHFILVDDHEKGDECVVIKGKLPDNIPGDGHIRMQGDDGEFHAVKYEGTINDAFLSCTGVPSAKSGSDVYVVLIIESDDPKPETSVTENEDVTDDSKTETSVTENEEITESNSESPEEDDGNIDTGTDNGVVLDSVDSESVVDSDSDSDNVSDTDGASDDVDTVDSTTTLPDNGTEESETVSVSGKTDEDGESGSPVTTKKDKKDKKRNLGTKYKKSNKKKKSQKPKKKKVPTGHVYWYSANPANPKDHKGIIVIAMKIMSKSIQYGVAYCSPNDLYVKHIGRELASARLKKEKNTVISKKKNPRFADGLRLIFAHIISQNNFPNWASNKIMYMVVSGILTAPAKKLFHALAKSMKAPNNVTITEADKRISPNYCKHSDIPILPRHEIKWCEECKAWSSIDTSK